MPRQGGVRIAIAGAGFTRTQAGTGSPITRGAGRLSIMDAGSMTRNLDGPGYLTRHGALRG